MPRQAIKPRVAIISLTSCEGCQFALLDLSQDFIDLTSRIDLVEMHLIEEDPEPEAFDIVFVEGNPITEKNFTLLKKIRDKSTLLITLGNCAALGGVWEMKNYLDKEKTLRYIYKFEKTVPNHDIKSIDNFVKIDYVVPGCPINAYEFLKIVYSLLLGKAPSIAENPVCYECQYNSYECQLQQNPLQDRPALPCLGPFIRGGCDAICLKSKMPCQGCRGLLKDADTAKMEKIYGDIINADELNNILEIFGIRDDFEKKKLTYKNEKN